MTIIVKYFAIKCQPAWSAWSQGHRPANDMGLRQKLPQAGF
jgi:hypothetical protein